METELRKSRFFTGLGLTALAVALTATPASAADSESEANEIASIIGDAAPFSAEAAAPDGVSAAGVDFDIAQTEVTVPFEAEGLVSMDAAGTKIEVSLPAGLDVEDGVLAGDGTVVFAESGDGAHAAIQALEDGSVRLQTVLDGAEAPSTYAYNFGDGVELALNDDGSVTVFEEVTDEVAVSVGRVEAPWAVDAVGADVPTHYTVNGSTLTQHVDHSVEYAYPITADPTISFGWAIYVKYSKSDVQTVTTGLGGAINDKAKFGFILCAKIPHWAAKAGCALVGTSYHTSIYNTFKTARANNQCVEIQLAYISYLPVVWKPYSC